MSFNTARTKPYPFWFKVIFFYTPIFFVIATIMDVMNIEPLDQFYIDLYYLFLYLAEGGVDLLISIFLGFFEGLFGLTR